MKRVKFWLIIFVAVLIGVGAWVSRGGMTLWPPKVPVEVAPTSAKVRATLVLQFSKDNIATYSGVQLEKGTTAFGILEKVAQENEIELVTKQYDFGIFIESIGGVENIKDRSWIYFVNGKSGEVAADKYELSDGDVVEWRYIEPIY